MYKFNKRDILYTLLIGISFFLGGSIFLSQESELSKLISNSALYSNGLGSFLRAIGICLFIILYKNKKKLKINIKYLYLIFIFITGILNALFWVTDSLYLKVILQLIICLIGLGGFGTGYNFSLLVTKVNKDKVGKYFGIGYAMGSVGTFILMKIPNLNLFSSSCSLFVFIPTLILIFVLILKYGNIIENDKQNEVLKEKKAIISLGVLIFIMSIIYSYATSLLVILTQGHNEKVVFDRMFSAIGFIIAGIIVDKNKKTLEITTIIGLLLPLIICIFVREGISIDILYSTHYFMSGFFTIFVTILFMDFGYKNTKYIKYASTGYALVRIIDGIMFFVTDNLLSNYVVSTLILFITFGLLIFYYYSKYEKEMNNIRYDSIKSKEEKINKFCHNYNISEREKEILKLLLEGKLIKEIAIDLYMAEGTVKNNLTKIYKKTGKNKNQIFEYLNID